MGYANPRQSINYSFGKVDFGTSTLTRIRGPKGLQGRLREVEVGGDTLFTAVTTPAHVKIGTAASATAYADLTLGALAADAAWAASNDLPAGITNRSLPADTDILIAFTAPTGGSPAGKGFPSIAIDWF